MEANLELASFLRSAERTCAPAVSLLLPHRRRRTPGLRREGLLQRAGISIEWLVKLEQGRAVSPSDETLDALGRALELDTVERVHLRSLVGKAKNPPFRREASAGTLPSPRRMSFAAGLCHGPAVGPPGVEPRGGRYFRRFRPIADTGS